MKSKKASEALRKAVSKGSWAEVIKIICSLSGESGLIHESQIILAMAHLEKKDYPLAYKVIGKAMLSAPFCPMVYWVLGNTMQQAGKHPEAIHAYVTLVSILGSRDCARCCVNHRAKAKGLVADSLLHSCFSYKALGEVGNARAAFEKHLSFRGPGCYSIYRLLKLPEKIGDLRAFRDLG